MSNRPCHIVALAIVLTVTSAVANAATVGDDFSPGPDLAWGNESGSWSAAGGNYGAGSPANFPNAYSGLPYDVTAFDLNVDIAAVADGGVWVHSAYTGAGTIGVRGILLVTLAGSLYWHDVTDVSSYGSSINIVGHLGFNNLRITATDNGGSFTYDAYLDGSMTAATSYTSSSFSSGRAALYANSAQRFDNFEISASDGQIPAVPVPVALWLFGPAVAGLLVQRRRH